jgi:hypothetical protein
VTYQTGTATAAQPGGAGAGLARLIPASDIGVRLVGALLAVAVAAVHVADQGGVTALTNPDWIGWSYRLIEASGVFTALLLLLPLPARLTAGWPAWTVAIMLGLGPFAAYISSRTVGLPGDPHDVGNWSDWTGTISLLVEAALVLLAASMLWPHRPRTWRKAA